MALQSVQKYFLREKLEKVPGTASKFDAGDDEGVDIESEGNDRTRKKEPIIPGKKEELDFVDSIAEENKDKKSEGELGVFNESGEKTKSEFKRCVFFLFCILDA